MALEIIVGIFILILIVGIILLIILYKYGYNLSNALGKKGKWTNVSKSLSQDLLITKANKKKVKLSPSCISCTISDAEKGYDPIDWISQFEKDGEDIKNILKGCSCTGISSSYF